MMNNISILVVNYNGSDFIKESIYSMCDLLIQNNILFEVLIIDNHSTDDSVSKIRELDFNKYNIIFFDSKENLGFGKGNNFLAKKAKYEVLMLLNNDTKTISMDNILNYMREERIKDKVITSKIYNKDMSSQNNIYNYPSLLKLTLDLFLLKPMSKILHQILTKKNDTDVKGTKITFCGCFFLISKENYHSINGFDEDYIFYHEEGDFFYRLSRKNDNIEKKIFDDKIIHYGGGGNEISDFAFINYYVGLYKLFIKNNIADSGILYKLFNVSFKLRLFLLKIGIKINYSPFSTLYNVKNTKTNIELINIHKAVLEDIAKWDKKRKNNV